MQQADDDTVTFDPAIVICGRQWLVRRMTHLFRTKKSVAQCATLFLRLSAV
jgi:hypothetical protein